MNQSVYSSGRTALTYKEVLIVVAVIALLLVVTVVPKYQQAKAKAMRISCVGNNKQIGLSFRIWANDNGNVYQMTVPSSEGGVKESIESGNVVRVFQVMSNELSVLETLICPADKRRFPQTNWTGLNKENISYFVGADAQDTKPDMLLVGDRNLEIDGKLFSGLVKLGANSPVEYTKRLHNRAGNIGLADGSVHRVAPEQLRQQLRNSGDSTNRLAFPQ